MELGANDACTTDVGSGPARGHGTHVTKKDLSQKPGLDAAGGRWKRDAAKIVEEGREAEDGGKSGIVSRFLASVKSQDLGERFRKPEDCSAPGNLPGSPDRKSRFHAVVVDAFRRSKKRKSSQRFEGGQRYSEQCGGDRHELTSGRTDANTRERTLNEPISGETIALSHSQNASHPFGTSLSRTKIPVFADLKKTRAQPNILTEQTDRKYINRNVSALDTDGQTDVGGRRNRRGSIKGHPVITEKTPESSINSQSAVSPAQPTERDIPQSISADSGIGSPTDAASGIGSVEKTVEGETIKAHEGSDLAIASADNIAIGKDQPQTVATSGGPFAPPPPTSITDVIPNYPLILPRDRLHPSQTPPGETCENDSAGARLTGGVGVDSEPDSPRSSPDQRSAASDTCSPDVIAESIIEKNDSGEDNTNKRTQKSNDHNSITSEFTSDQESEDENLPENVDGPSPNVADTLISDGNIDSVSSSAQPDTPTEFTLSNIIRTLISNQNKRRIQDLEESNSSSEQAHPSQEQANVTDSKVQIEEAGPTDTDLATRDKGVPEKPVRRKLTFRNVSLQDVIALADSPNTDRKLKGILKSTSVPALSSGLECISDQLRETNGAFKSELPPTSRCVSFNKTHIKNTFSYYNDAFEGEVITEPSKRPSLADVVSQIMRQGAIIDMEDDNSHPYGRDTSLTDLITGKRRDNYKMDAGKMIVWLVLAVMLVCLAGGIIFMSETYNMNNAGDNDAAVSVAETTTLSKLPR